LERSKQGILLPGTAIQDPIDEERGGALHSATFTALYIFLDAGKKALCSHIACVLLQIEANLSSEAGQVRILKGMLVMEKGIVHLPKLPLRCSGLGSQSRVQRVGMDFGEGEVAKDKAQLVAELVLNCSHDGRRSASVGAFVVAILHQGNRGCGRPLVMVPFSDGDHKTCLW
jgi:hypothetical protein